MNPSAPDTSIDSTGGQPPVPSRPLLRYFGGKWQLRGWIGQYLPPHAVYAEPFAGAASILLSKPVAEKGEILNDLNRDLINLFRVMQDKALADDLQRRLDWTPYAKDELDLSIEESPDQVERARRLIVRSFMGIEVSGVETTRTGFRMGNVDLGRLGADGKRTFRNCARDWANWRDELEIIRLRLARVMIYSRDALDFMRLMDAPDCLLYIDPPYAHETRKRVRYKVDFNDHEALVAQLLASHSMIVLSGYPTARYAPLEAAGWRRVEKDYRANMSNERRTECLWINPAAQQ